MKPFIWWSGSRWFVTKPRTEPGYEWTAWPGTSSLGYRTLQEAYGSTIIALTLTPS